MSVIGHEAVAVEDRARRGHHPGLALTVIAGAQLMVVLDATIVNIALPHIQDDLHFSDTSLSWVLNAYTLTFGGLLLLGGRAGDILGRRRVFVAGILLFSVASLLGGFAPSAGLLLAARALQGVGGAIASPTALSLITTNFAEGAERNRAFGVFAAVSGAGAAVGLIAGGMLTSWLSWRWVLFVNVPIGVALIVLAPLYINESIKHPGRFDIGGALTSTLGLSSLVYGFIRAATPQYGWSDAITILAFVAAAVLLAVFIVIEVRHPQPIMPLHMFRDRNRASSYLVMLLLAAALFSMFFFLTQFVQKILGYSPLRAGFAFLPVSATIVIFAQIASRRLLAVGPKRFMVAGSVLAVLGLAWMSRISPESTYLTGVLGPIVVFAAGMGLFFVPITIIAVSGVEVHESGAASGLLNVMQQVGGSLGLSILVTVFSRSVSNKSHTLTPDVLNSPKGGQIVFAHGVSTALQMGVLFAALALLVTILGVTAKPSDLDTDAVPGVGA